MYESLTFLILSIFIIYFFLSKKENDKKIHKRIMLAFTVIVCLLQGNIFTSLFEILKCNEFHSDDNKKYYYIQSSLSTLCYDDNYNKWIFFLIIPSMVFYGVFLPSLAYIYMFFNKNSLYNNNVMMYVGFIVNGYKKEKNFWEFFFFFRRILLNLIIIFFDKNLAPEFVMIILLISLFLQYKNQPFLTKQLNRYEFYSIFCVCVTLALAIFSQSSNSLYVQEICTALIFLPNCVFMLLIGKILIYLKLEDILKEKNNLIQKLFDKIFNSKSLYFFIKFIYNVNK